MNCFAQFIAACACVVAVTLLAPGPAAAQAQSNAQTKTNVAKQVQDRIKVVTKKVQAACRPTSSAAART